MKTPDQNEVYQYLRGKADAAAHGDNPKILGLCNDALIVFEHETGIEGIAAILPKRTNSHAELIDFLKADKIMASLYKLRLIDSAIATIVAAQDRKTHNQGNPNRQLQLPLF